MADDDPELAAIRARRREEALRRAAPGGLAPVDLTDDSMQGFVRAQRAAVVDFWAPWCGPCRIVGPMLDEIQREYKGALAVGKVNVDEHPREAQRFGVQGIPTLVLFREGRPVDVLVGALPKHELVSRIHRALFST
ncbi:MAG: thioredoxin [Methanobacteriota archaeon]